ncbi:hypothetical protein SRHO_G00104540 [Serrasalmus rhombeus]
MKYLKLKVSLWRRSFVKRIRPLQRYPVRWPALGTVWSAPGLIGPPALTPAPIRTQKADRAACEPSWPYLGKEVKPVLLPRLWSSGDPVMIIPVSFSTGKPPPGGRAPRIWPPL